MQLVWEPHPHQQLVKNAVFSEGKKVVFIECGRKYGKTDLLCYILYRFAMMYPNSACYYIAPFQKQAREIIWANGRLQNFFVAPIDPKTKRTFNGYTREEALQIGEELKAKYLKGNPNDSEMRIKFNNGSFIKLDGADNYQAYRGISPHIVVYDEFKDHHPKFHTGMDPNLATFDAPLIAVGTPPEGDEPNEEGFCSMADYAKIAEDQAYFNAPTHVNPHISRKFLERKQEELRRKGEYTKWLREYMAMRVRDGERTIFPMFEVPTKTKPHTKHVKPHAEVIHELQRKYKDWDFVTAYDPASTTTFGALFCAIHKYEKRIKVWGEVYAQGMVNTSTDKVFPESLKVIDKLNVPHYIIDMVYDHAAHWFANEVHSRYTIENGYMSDYALTPCTKDYNTKNDKLSLIKDIFLGYEGLIEISDSCVHFIKELENYRTDQKGKPLKENDHLIDCFRYILNYLMYTEVPKIRPNPFGVDEGLRYSTMERDFDEIPDPWGMDLAELA